MKLRVLRYNATGNTFLFCDLQDFPFDKKDRPSLVRQMCAQYQGFQTDGFVFFQMAKNKMRVDWDFYNADGSIAEMCGNAARAMAFHLRDYLTEGTWILGTLAGNVELGLEAMTGWPQIRWQGVVETQWEQELIFQEQMVPFDFIQVGVPHAVVELDPFPELAKFMRSQGAWHARGMNVTFVEQRAPGEVSAVTFERGVEDFTLACGTGAMAAALWSWELNPELKIHQIFMPGGELRVHFAAQDDIYLIGPVSLDFEMEVEL